MGVYDVILTRFSVYIYTKGRDNMTCVYTYEIRVKMKLYIRYNIQSERQTGVGSILEKHVYDMHNIRIIFFERIFYIIYK